MSINWDMEFEAEFGGDFVVHPAGNYDCVVETVTEKENGVTIKINAEGAKVSHYIHLVPVGGLTLDIIKSKVSSALNAFGLCEAGDKVSPKMLMELPGKEACVELSEDEYQSEKTGDMVPTNRVVKFFKPEKEKLPF